jgi:hypothetical protein
MIGWRFKRNVTAHDAAGKRYALEEHVKLIDTTTAFSKGQRDVAEADKKWYFGPDGLVAGTDPFAEDGSLEVEGSSMRLWLDDTP